MRYTWRFLAGFAIAATTAVAGDDPATLQRFARSEMHMGVEFEVVLYASDASVADPVLSKAMARIAALDKALSDYDPESELSKLSETSTSSADQSAIVPVVKLSDDLWNVLSTSQAISRASDGAFDVT